MVPPHRYAYGDGNRIKTVTLTGMLISHSEFILMLLLHRINPVVLPKRFLVVEEYQDLVWLYYLMVQHLFASMVRIAAKLRRWGLLRALKLIIIGNTTQVCTSSHGG